VPLIPDEPGLDVTGAPTMGVARPPGPSTAPLENRFASGSIVAGRYRLVSLLGRGGMGEVYRADDLTLGQPIALKFLSGDVAGSDARLAQFHNELRVARQVSHKNVCRLYDLGEADGRRFLTMEYVDGEDLSASLRRFGRMPPDKAIQIARQLCAGIAAAHEKGVLHRDLKPANVMLDGNGDVRITDFGIATAAADAGGILVGTPQYMAPELLAGKPASISSDIYALGLILFEVFTGKRAYEAKTIAQLRELHDGETLTTPSSIVPDLDPAVERAILRCLDKDPSRRPASALTVAAALPGADPLAAALAAGETPSPELLMAAGESEAMPVRRALPLTIAFVVMLLVAVGLMARGSIVGWTDMPIPRDALADRATQILRQLGQTGPVADTAAGFSINADSLRWAERADGNDWWSALRASRIAPITFWYRTSPTELLPLDVSRGTVESTDPPMTTAGMSEVTLDAEGRLLQLQVVPTDTTPVASGALAAPPWDKLFAAADLDLRTFTAVPPRWTPFAFADATAAWEGPMPGRTNQRIRVEAAALAGRPVSFRIVWPWVTPNQPAQPPRSSLQQVLDALDIGLWITLLAGAVVLARRNLRVNRADRRGAARFGVSVMLMSLAASLLGGAHSTDPQAQMSQFLGGLTFAAFVGGEMWILYLAVEPYGRRFWPDALLAWTRLWSGRVRDARVGRELLIGMVFGALALVVVEVPKLLPITLGWHRPQFLFGNQLWMLSSTLLLVKHWVSTMNGGLQNALMLAMVFLALRLLLRRPQLALVAGVAVLLAFMNNGEFFSGTWIDKYNVLAMTVLLTLVLHRYGLVAAAMTLFVDNLVNGIPLTTHLSVWWSTSTVLTVTLLVALVAFSYYSARTGEPLFGDVIVD